MSNNGTIFDQELWPRINFVAAALFWLLALAFMASTSEEHKGYFCGVIGTLCWVAFCLSPDDRGE